MKENAKEKLKKWMQEREHDPIALNVSVYDGIKEGGGIMLGFCRYRAGFEGRSRLAGGPRKLVSEGLNKKDVSSLKKIFSKIERQKFGKELLRHTDEEAKLAILLQIFLAALGSNKLNLGTFSLSKKGKSGSLVSELLISDVLNAIKDRRFQQTLKTYVDVYGKLGGILDFQHIPPGYAWSSINTKQTSAKKNHIDVAKRDGWVATNARLKKLETVFLVTNDKMESEKQKDREFIVDRTLAGVRNIKESIEKFLNQNELKLVSEDVSKASIRRGLSKREREEIVDSQLAFEKNGITHIETGQFVSLRGKSSGGLPADSQDMKFVKKVVKLYVDDGISVFRKEDLFKAQMDKPSVQKSGLKSLVFQKKNKDFNILFVSLGGGAFRLNIKFPSGPK